MYNYLVNNPLLAIIFLLVVSSFIIFLLVKLLQKIGIEKVREVVYKGFVEAEVKFLYEENHEKFEYVVNLAKSSIPLPFSLFITDKLLRHMIQLWFDLCKDMLDDGVINNSQRESEVQKYE